MAGGELDQFVTQIINEKRLSGVTDDVRAQLVDDLKRELMAQINRALIDALPEEKLDAFNLLLEDETSDETIIQQFIMNSGIDVTNITARTMLRFRDLYLQPTGERA